MSIISYFYLFTNLQHFFSLGTLSFQIFGRCKLDLINQKKRGSGQEDSLEKLAMSVTLTTSIIIPITGLMLIESWGGLHGAPWAWNAYLAFWLMAAISITPDMIRYGRNRNAEDPKHGMVSGAIRGNVALVLTVYIMCCMILKISWITPFSKLGLFS